MNRGLGVRTLKRITQLSTAIVVTLMIGGWTDVSTIDQMTDKKILAYAVSAKKAIHFAGQTITPYLVIGCIFEDPGHKDVFGSYIKFTQPIAQFAEGQFRFDQGQIKEFRSAGGAQGGDMINVSLYYDPDFAAVISASVRFRVEVQLVTGREFFEFDVRKASAVISKLPCRAH